MAEPLTAAAVAHALNSLPNWSGDTAALMRTFRFPGFPAAIAFMHACTAGIEQNHHHPEWSNVYDRVSIRLSTHDAGNRVTALDVALATLLETTAKQHGGS